VDEARTPLIISGPAVVNNDHSYDQIKPVIQSLVNRQQKLCDQFLKGAEDVLEKLNSEEGAAADIKEELQDELGLLLYKAKLGQPRSDRLLRILENPDNIRLMNKAESTLHTDQTKKTTLRAKRGVVFCDG